ncbi:hypothetical protein H4Q26_002414 [Puccinia striiformis f. sp. tritici PST-130]|nr:hypothetical protein H4Q26_002414 [Puccinia striiformis f. sp. tritici PST-130]
MSCESFFRVPQSQEKSEANHGRYVEVKQEKKLIQITAKAKTSVVHFFRPEFEQCKTMDKKLEELSSTYFSTRFLSVDVANVPWLVERLQVKVLPCVVGFLNGLLKDEVTMGAAQAHQRSGFSSGIRQGSDGDSDSDD